MWGERSSITNAVIVGALLAALAGLSVLAWAVAAPGPAEAPTLTDATADDHLVYLLGPDAITVIDPESRETVQTIFTEYDPEIALAPDGTTIYLTDGTPPVLTLSVIDSHSGAIVAQRPSPNRISNRFVGSSGMAVSADGRYVYIHKWELLEGRYEGDGGTFPATDHWWDIYDTTTQDFSDDPPHVPNCGIAQAFPPQNESALLAVLCYQRSVLVFVDLQSGEITRSISSRDDTNGRCARSDTRVAGALQSPDGTIYLVTTEGCVRVIDPVAMAMTYAFASDIPDGWQIPYDMVALSPAGDRLLLGVGPSPFAEDHSAGAWVIDVATQSLVSTISLDPDARSMAVSPDGSLLYVVSQESSLSAIEIASGEEVWRLTGLNSPEVVRVAPRPQPASDSVPRQTCVLDSMPLTH
ncbi:MAG TPA: hypothetical protein VIT93_04205 [Dehalococcoidia bacterium]